MFRLIFCLSVTLSFATGWAADSPAALRVLTYNVLADPWKTQKRVPELMRILDESDADVIALQEVAPWFARALETQAWIDKYEYPVAAGELQIAHEFVILSKFPVVRRQTLPLPSKQGRIAFFTTLKIGEEELTVVTCHLDSYLEDGPTRAKQLEIIFAQLAQSPEAILLGDLNFGDGEQPDTNALSAEFIDPWLALYRSVPGYTWDRERNPKAKRDSFPGERSRRLDRILIRSRIWIPAEIRIIGDTSIADTRPALYPSDHFGVLAVFEERHSLHTP